MKITVSEHFYSIQGEGKTMGKPSVFLRLTACNLMCGGRGTEKDFKLHNEATWRCDTIEVWRQGTSYEVKEFVNIFIDNYSSHFIKGAHLIITDGEPLLQFVALESFIELLEQQLGFKPFIEIETNGTLTPKGKLFNFIDLINCSPKLSNSGEIESKRLKINVLQFYTLTPKSIFKFVVSRNEDIKEIKDIIKKTNISSEKIYLMPSAKDKKELEKNTKIVTELCLDNGYNFSTRLQIIIWNETTGV